VGELPQGTVTLLFTDVEGSTQLQHRMAERYHEVVAEHRRLLEQAFAEQGGIVVDRQTESFFVVFTRARYALQAAAAAQGALAEHDWPDGVQVKVRMGIHSGDPEVAGDRYVGLAVARAARICAAAHGGQVLLSSSARALLTDHDRSALRSLGPHRLKDFEEPEPISQLIVDGLPSQFPSLRTEAASPRRKQQLLLAAGLVVAAGAIAGVLLAFSSGGSSSVTVGPTSLAVIDPTSNRIVDAIDVGFKSNLIAAGEGSIWLVDPQGSTLVKIDPATRKIVNTIGIAVGAGSIPFGLAVGNGAVWVAVFRDSREVVLELGPDVGNLRRTIPYGGQTQTPVLFRVNPLAVGDGAAWAIDPALGGVWRIPQRGKAREAADGLDALSLAAGGDAVWVAGVSVLTKLDALTGLQLGSASVGSPLSADTASVAVGQGAVWYTASSQATLSKLDPQSASITQTFPIGKGPSGIAIGERAVWVANSGDGTVSRLDSGGGAPRTIRLGQTPGGVVAAYGNVWTSPGQRRS
jgi:class 3 adenylate cyclase/streptogramin lyase